MSDTKHTPEPWVVLYSTAGIEIAGAGGSRNVVRRTGEAVRREADFERIAACVNALEGWADPGAARQLLEAAAELMKAARELGGIGGDGKSASNFPSVPNDSLGRLAAAIVHINLEYARKAEEIKRSEGSSEGARDVEVVEEP